MKKHLQTLALTAAILTVWNRVTNFNKKRAAKSNLWTTTQDNLGDKTRLIP